MMLIQSGSVFEILLGRDSGWKPQRRDDGSIPIADIVRRHRSHMVLGAVAGLAVYIMSPALFTWMSPTIIGLLLAIPLSWASGQLAIGLWLRRRGLLTTPEETVPPPVAVRANSLSVELMAAGEDATDALWALHHDEVLRGSHDAMLPAGTRTDRGKFEPDRVMAQAKLTGAQTLEEACEWLTPKERFVALHDRALIGLLTRLPCRPEQIS
jgi:membrane glycosyltransferase